MTSVAQRLGRKKKLIYLSRGNCLGAVSAKQVVFASAFLEWLPRDEGHVMTIVITGMTDSDHYNYLPLIWTQLSVVSSRTGNKCFWSLQWQCYAECVCGSYDIWNESHLNFHLVNRSSGMAAADGQVPSWLDPPDDCGLRVYTVYSVYSRELHPNLASVNDPHRPHSPQQREIRESKRRRHPPIKIVCIHASL